MFGARAVECLLIQCIHRNDLWILTLSEYCGAHNNDSTPQERLTAEPMVVHNPLFVAERARGLAHGVAERHVEPAALTA